MKKKKLSDKAKSKNKIKTQPPKTNLNELVAEYDNGVTEASFNRLRHGFLELTGFEGKMVWNESTEKMSDILLKYAAPLLNAIGPNDNEMCEKAIMIAIIFWNYSITQGDSKNLDETMEMLKPLALKPLASGAELESIVSYMLRRKMKMFPGNNRIIVSYDFIIAPGGFHLAVASMEWQD
jgi:hypothetical protein